MTEHYRVTERESVYMGNRPFTLFSLFERRPHPIQGHAYEFVGQYRAEGHEASEHDCIRAALAAIHGPEEDDMS